MLTSIEPYLSINWSYCIFDFYSLWRGLYVRILIIFVNDCLIYTVTLAIRMAIILGTMFTIRYFILTHPHSINTIYRVHQVRISASNLQCLRFRLSIYVPKKSSLFWVMAQILWIEFYLIILTTSIKACASLRIVLGKLLVRTTWIMKMITMPGK